MYMYQSTLDKVSAKIIWLLTHCWLRCQSSIDRVSFEMLTKCWLRCQSHINWRSIKDINWHSADTFSTVSQVCSAKIPHTWPSIMYEIIIMESVLESGNLSGSLVVSMSNASTTGSWRDRTKVQRLVSRAFKLIINRWAWTLVTGALKSVELGNSLAQEASMATLRLATTRPHDDCEQRLSRTTC